jgi:hypothetical protein
MNRSPSLLVRWCKGIPLEMHRRHRDRRIPLLAMLGWLLCTRLAAAGDPVTFEDQIRPLLKARCFNCHGETDKPEGQLDVRLVRLLSAGGDSGPAIVPGKREESPLYLRLRDGEMPPEDAPGLTKEQVELVGRWIDEGARTRRPEPADVSAAQITEEDRAFWSFQPLLRTPPPSVVLGPSTGVIDRFIQQTLSKSNLIPAPPADRRTLLRRLSFVLTGLPPTQDEVAYFQADGSLDRYEREVDRLLASPHYGERWGRVWLDLVRYVDEVPAYGTTAKHAWRYRDWVVDSFNSDRPYDEFVRLQLAADLIPETAPDDLVALGMLGLSPNYWKELKLAPDVIKVTVADEWDERVDMVSRTFLGLSVACARCHNHKFDPITIEDYYALAGVMANSQIVERPVLSRPRAETVLKAQADLSALDAKLKGLPTESPPEVAEYLRVEMEAIRLGTADLDAPTAHMVQDASLDILPEGDDATQLVPRPGKAKDLPLFRRGNPSDLGPIVPRRFLTVLCAGDAKPFHDGSGRRELADALFRESQALTARVIVNRIWGQIFGQGLVRSVSDFGQQGDRPTHPELLDYLALRLIEENWSMKRLIREMVLSATFQQNSHGTPAAREADPNCQLLSRMPRRKLDVEPWRDGLLAVAGKLNDRMTGPAEEVDGPTSLRRTLYGKVAREDLHVMLRLFDFPEGGAHNPCREPTTTPLQQLYVLNGPLLDQLATAVGTELAVAETPMSSQVDRCYQMLFQRPPTPSESSRAIAFLQSAPDGTIDRRRTWVEYVHVLLSLNETMFLD